MDSKPWLTYTQFHLVAWGRKRWPSLYLGHRESSCATLGSRSQSWHHCGRRTRLWQWCRSIESSRCRMGNHGKQDGKTWECQSGRCGLKHMWQVPFSHLIGLMFVPFYFLRKANSAISCCGFCGVPPRLWEFLSGYSCNHGLDTENLRVSFQFWLVFHVETSLTSRWTRCNIRRLICFGVLLDTHLKS